MPDKMGTPSINDSNILDALKTRLENIKTTGNNYYSNFANKVFINKTTPFETTGLNIRDDSDELVDENISSADLCDVDLYVEIDLTTIGATDCANILKMKADILKAIGTDLTFGGLAIHTKYVGSQRNRVNQLGEKISDLTIRIKINYRKNAWSA